MLLESDPENEVDKERDTLRSLENVMDPLSEEDMDEE